jgi:hypothetical protein
MKEPNQCICNIKILFIPYAVLSVLPFEIQDVTVISYREINAMDLEFHMEHVNRDGWQSAEVLALNPAVHTAAACL